MNKNIVIEKLSKTFDVVYPKSILEDEKQYFILVKDKGKKRMVIVEKGKSFKFKIQDLEHNLALELKSKFPHLNPKPIGTATAFGLGDRLGIATAGHVRAIRNCQVVPIFAQQSIRELNKTHNKPEEVMDNALWGIIQEGYNGIYGADADHLKTKEDLKMMASAGFTMFTIDPSDHIRKNFATKIERGKMREILRKYSGKSFDISEPRVKKKVILKFNEDDLQEIVNLYYPAIEHIVNLYNLLKVIFSSKQHFSENYRADRKCVFNKNEILNRTSNVRKDENPFDFEVSIDETTQPTTPLAHLFITLELKSKGVCFQSLAPKFVGEFQKAIDFIGNLNELKENIRLHSLIARKFGPYKISIHSGSDKFSAFPIIGKECGSLLHVKTSGTSYLSALKVIARKEPNLYREIHKFALKSFNEEKKHYVVSTNVTNIPPIDSTSDKMLVNYLLQNDSRQLLHITYGAVLTEKDKKGKFIFKDRILESLNKNEEEHYKELRIHIRKHLSALGWL